jgi:hypothetical protein
MGFKHGDIHMMVFFEQLPKEGKPLAMKGLARGLRKLERALQLMNVVGGKVDWKDGVPKIIVNATAGGSAGGIGRIIVAGVPKEVPSYPETPATNKWCLMVYFDGSPPVWVDWDMDDPQPSDAEIYDPDYTFGDIHVPRIP